MAELENDISKMDRENDYDSNYSVVQCKDFFLERITRWCGSDDAERVIGGLEDLLRIIFQAGARNGGLYGAGDASGKTGSKKAYPLHKILDEVEAEPIYKAMVGVDIMLMIQRIKLLGYGYGSYRAVRKKENEPIIYGWAAQSRHI